MLNKIYAWFQCIDGATAIEYGIILALMFLVILGALTAFGGSGSGIFNTAMNTLKSAMGG